MCEAVGPSTLHIGECVLQFIPSWLHAMAAALHEIMCCSASIQISLFAILCSDTSWHVQMTSAFDAADCYPNEITQCCSAMPTPVRSFPSVHSGI